MSHKVPVNILIEGDVAEAVASAVRLGYVESRRLDLVPVSSGEIPADSLDELKRLPGIGSVEIDSVVSAQA